MKPQMIDALKRLAEGQFSPDEWLEWWAANSQVVKKQLKPGQFLRLKPSSGMHKVDAIDNSQQEACKILIQLGLEFKRSDCYEKSSADLAAQNEPRWDFDGDVMVIVEEEIRGSCNQAFLDRIFKAYEKAGSPRARKKWLRERLREEFKFVEHPPKWAKGYEPAWPIVDGVPAVFVKQFTVPENEVSKNWYGGDMNVYIFGYRSYRDDGNFELKHVVLKQQR